MHRRAAGIAFVAAIAIGCGSDSTAPAPKPAPVASVSVTSPFATITIGDTMTLTVITRDSVGTVLTGRQVSFVSGAPGVATVSTTGTVTAIAVGTTVVTATSEGKVGTVVISVVMSPALCSNATPLSLGVGQVVQLTGSSREALCVAGGTSGAEYALIPINGSAERQAATVSLAAANTVAPAGPVGPGAAAAALTGPGGPANEEPRASGRMPRDYAFETALREKTRHLHAEAVARARASGALRQRPAAVAGLEGRTPPALGTLVTLNASSSSACGPASTMRGARVVAVSNSAIVVEDTLRPSGGFTPADYQSVATIFDTLVYALDTTAFGAPADIDQNGRVILFFTPAVNALTQSTSTSVVEGFFFERDLYPHQKNAFVGIDCPTSNEAEMFYLPVVDPAKVYNGYFTSKDTLVADVIGTTIHEFQHLINASRRFYVTTAYVNEEEGWLNEAMSHLAQEILYLHVAGLTPRSHLTYQRSVLDPPPVRGSAMRSYQADNLYNFSTYLRTTETATAYAPTDPQIELTTRGAAWALLRYALDQSPGRPEPYLRALVDATTEGIPNFNTVFASIGGLAGALRGALVANFVSDAVNVAPIYTYPSWNFRDWLPHFVANSRAYPLTTRSLPDGSNVTIGLKAGGSSIVRFGIGPQLTGAIAIAAGGAAGAGAVDLMLVRTK